MIRISALNEGEENESDTPSQPEVATREAQEEEAFTLYNKALQLQNENDHEKAEEVYKQLLQTKFLAEAIQSDETSGLVQPNLLLKYSTYKNLANIAAQKSDYYKAMESYLEAISLDGSDVAVWYKIGTTALKLHNYPLARLAFQEGLKCNPNHWPCLDNLVTVLYALSDYATCLYFISQAFEKEPLYTKGLAIRDKIFQEHPSLRRDSVELFKGCDESIFSNDYEPEEANKFIEESLEMRRIKKELSSLPEPPVLRFTKPWRGFTWKCLGSCSIALYDHIWDSIPNLSYGCRVDTAKYLDPEFLESQQHEAEKCEETMDISDEQPTLLAIPSINIVPDATDPSAHIPSLNDSLVMEVEDTVIPQRETPRTSEESGGISRKLNKRKRILMEFGDPLSKRRSARVRNTGVIKKQDNIDYCQLLQKFLPSSLIKDNKESKKLTNSSTLSPLNPENPSKLTNGKTVESQSESQFSTNEEADVRAFLADNITNGGILDVMHRFLIALGSERQHTTWPAGLVDVYIAIYEKLRTHITKPSLLCQELDNDVIKNDGMFTLMYSELKMDKWHRNRLKVSALSPSGSFWASVNCPSTLLGPDFPGKYFREDLEYLVQLTVRRDVFGSDWMDYFIRVMWLRARFLLLLGQIDFAVDSFDRITSCIENEQSNGIEIKIVINNCQMDKLVTLDQVQTQLETLRRCQSLEEVHCLFESGEYRQVVDLLTLTFHQPQPKGKVNNKNAPERHAQLQLLQDSLWNLENWKDCLRWSELSFDEALQRYVTQGDKQIKSQWIATISHLLSGLENCISKDETSLDSLESESLIRMAQNLIRIISIQMESSESSSDSFDCVFPWILLYRLIDHEERKIRKLASKRTDGQSGGGDLGEFGPGVPSSLMLLYNAHDFLGRRAWCCNSDGALLLLYSEVLLKEMEGYSLERPHPYKEDLEMSVEQCYYCLYGHPHKRTKARHLQEHNSPQITLTLERSISVFSFFKPKPLPEFDSHKANTVSAEFENLMRRIITLIPPLEDGVLALENINAYIEGQTDDFPVIPENKMTKVALVQELYYLLGDYHFKNKEFGKASRYYILDLGVNPRRLDSWAGMALARSSQLEHQLNVVSIAEDEKKIRKEAKGEMSLYRKAACALRCFQGAVHINKHNVTLWIEYGSLAYMVHSHISRQLKQQEQLVLSSDIVSFLKEKRDELLEIAGLCFTSANQSDADNLEEEQWLHHYMLGKIGEKQGKALEDSLEHYRLAAIHLYERGARYPRKIQYHNPPDLSLEALEVFFRTHAATLKYLLKRESELLSAEFCQVVHSYLKQMLESPFATYQEQSRYTASLSSSDGEEPSPIPLLPPGEQPKPKTTLGCVTYDHDYFRRKRKDSSTTEESEIDSRLRHSADSSSESLDSATIKEVVNNIISVVSERVPDKVENCGNEQTLIVLGDSKIQKCEELSRTGMKTNEEVKDRSKKDELDGKKSLSNYDTGDRSKSEATDSTSTSQSNLPAPVCHMVVEGANTTSKRGSQTVSNSSESSTRKESLSPSTDVNLAAKQLIKNTELSGKVVGEPGKDSRANADAEAVDQKILTTMCLSAMRQCLQRFPQHYKSLHRLADYHCHSTLNKNYHWSRDFLLGRSIPWQQIPHMPSQGLFNERKNSNLFNGIWRIPNDEIDRPGSFVSHMYRSVILLAKILIKLKDFFVLVNLITQLFRTPETGKKFLRDSDRLIGANMVQNLTLTALRDEMKRLCSADKTADAHEKIVKHILSVYRVWHNLVKGSDGTGEVNHLFEDVFRMYLKYTDISESASILDQALKFCQQQLTLTRSPKVSYVPAMDLMKSVSSVSLGSGIEGDKRDVDDEKLSSTKHSLKIAGTPELPSKSLAQWKALEKKDIPTGTPISTSKPKLTLKEVAATSSTDSAVKPMKTSNWAPSNIPSSGVIIGSMTITPVGAPTQTPSSLSSTPSAPQTEGLFSRLASSKPRSPLNLSTATPSASPKPTTPTVKSTPSVIPVTSASAKFGAPFDPSRLTADVQSKITSLDPVEHASRSGHTALSGFQMEFLRQLSQNQNLQQPMLTAPSKPTATKPRGRGAGASKIIHQSHGAAHSVWGNRAPIATPTSRSTENSVSISLSAANKVDSLIMIKKESSTSSCPQPTTPKPVFVPGEISSTSLLSKSTVGSGNVTSTTDPTKGSDSKPCAVQLRSIRISSITQESAKRILPPVLPTTGKPAAMTTLPTVRAKPSTTESTVELITLSSSPSPEGSTVND